ncbi:MAG: hypothetical protein R3C26_18610 [Calditrichia bacterium]
MPKKKGLKPAVILIASGKSEVAIVMEAKKQLDAAGIDTRMVSMPSWELFRMQSRNIKKRCCRHQ